jgi:ubiquinone/menaquinone biosynthesis C-methylase UbiE
MKTKAYKGIGMEGVVATWYARITRRDLAEVQALAKRISEELAEEASVLEVAPGPGYFAIELAQLGRYKITGLDISDTFVRIARQHAREKGVQIDFRRGNASSMPFKDRSFDRIVCRAAFKNFTDPVGALQEMHRVLTEGGLALIIDLRRDTPKPEIDAYVNRMKIGKLNAAFVKWTFRLMLLKRAYTREDFERFIEKSGFPKSQITDAPIGFEITLTK